jgi:hypothetical protein
MNELNIDFVSQFPKFVKEIIDIANGPIQTKKERRIQFFEYEIKPLHNMMCEINEDYVTGFMRILEFINKKQQCINDIDIHKYNECIFNAINEQRHNKLMKRVELSAFSKELKTIKKTYFNKYDILLFIDYANAIESYINYYSVPIADNVAIAIKKSWPGDSMYSNLLSSIRDINSFGNYYKLNNFIVAVCKNALNTTIPMKFKNYLNNYIKLKLNYLE